MTQIQMQHTNQRRFPHSYSSDIEQMNVEMLCAYGKELVSELLNRITTMFHGIKGDVENKSNKIQIEDVFSDVQVIIFTLTQVRLRIDLKRLKDSSNSRSCLQVNDDELFNFFTNPSLPKQSSDHENIAKEFLENRAFVIRLNTKLKKLDWLASQSDPKTLIKKTKHE